MLLSNAYNPDDRVRNEALALKDSGDIVIIAWDRFLDKPQQEVTDGIAIKRIRLKAGYGQAIGKFFAYFFVWILFFIQLAKLKPDIVHCHDFDTYFVGLAYTSLYKKTKLIFDAHENYYMMMKPLVPRTVSQFIAFLEKRFVKCANFVISSCDATASYYQEKGAKNIVVIGNWKDPSSYAFPLEQIDNKRKEIGANGRLIVTYIGSLTSDRNVMPLIQAVRNRPWSFLVIGGTAGQEKEIRQQCTTLSNAYFPGYIHPDEVPLLTSASDVIYYGLNSTDSYAPYNAPNKLFEALGAGKPIIASDLGGELSKIVKSEECGILLSSINSVSIGEALDEILDSALRKKMETNSKKAGEYRYNWKIASTKLVGTYQKIIQA